MADTTAQMNTLKDEAAFLAIEKKHVLEPFEEFMGGAIHISECSECERFVWVEIFPSGHDMHGPVLQKECGDIK